MFKSVQDDGSQYAFSHDGNHTWESPWPTQAFQWALLASKNAISLTHIDAGGFATRVRVIHGLKLWAVQVNPGLPNKDGWDKQDDAYWDVVVLGPQEDL